MSHVALILFVWLCTFLFFGLLTHSLSCPVCEPGAGLLPAAQLLALLALPSLHAGITEWLTEKWLVHVTCWNLFESRWNEQRYYALCSHTLFCSVHFRMLWYDRCKIFAYLLPHSWGEVFSRRITEKLMSVVLVWFILFKKRKENGFTWQLS